jgi:hypothetical protein
VADRQVLRSPVAVMEEPVLSRTAGEEQPQRVPHRRSIRGGLRLLLLPPLRRQADRAGARLPWRHARRRSRLFPPARSVGPRRTSGLVMRLVECIGGANRTRGSWPMAISLDNPARAAGVTAGTRSRLPNAPRNNSLLSSAPGN